MRLSGSVTTPSTVVASNSASSTVISRADASNPSQSWCLTNTGSQTIYFALRSTLAATEGMLLAPGQAYINTEMIYSGDISCRSATTTPSSVNLEEFIVTI